MGSVLSMYASTACNGANQNAVASVIVPQRGNLVGIAIAAQFPVAGATGALAMQIAFGASGFPNVTPYWAIIKTWRLLTNLLTSGHVRVDLNEFVPLPNIPVFLGQYIYYHQNGTNAILPVVDIQLMFDFVQPFLP